MVDNASSSEYRAAKSGRQAVGGRKGCVSQGVKRRELLLPAFRETCRFGFCLCRRLRFIVRRDFDQLGLKLFHRVFKSSKLSIGTAQVTTPAHCFEIFGGGDSRLGAEDCNGALQGMRGSIEFRSILSCECG